MAMVDPSKMNKPCKFFTRTIFTCPLFGTPQELRESRLPTYEDMIRCCFQERYNLSPDTGNKEPSFSQIAENVSKKIENLYVKSTIPTVSHTRVIQIIHAYHKKYQCIMKNYKKDKDKAYFQKKMKDFFEEAKKTLFDIAACKCKDFQMCTCEKSKKVPVNERLFLQDQRSLRVGYIGCIDIPTSRALQKKAKRTDRYHQRLSFTDSPDSVLREQHFLTVEEPEILDLDDITDLDYHCHDQSSLPSTSQMRNPLSATSVVCDRYRIPDRAAAAISSAVLQDFGIISEENISQVIDKNNMRRKRSLKRSELQSTKKWANATDDPIAIFFDGRKDKTLCQVKEGNKYYRREILEEHISVVVEPGSQYFGHLTPSSGTAKCISTIIFESLKEQEVNSKNITAIGCDGTVVNTGHKSGVIRLLEIKFKKPLQWLVCLLHFNELPLRHLFEHLDGGTTGPRKYSGLIGKSLEKCESLPIANFKPVECDLPVARAQELSTDQIYLFDISQAIQTGKCSSDLSRRNPGPISHARWLTTANRILRLYVGTEEPSPELIQLVQYIMKVYCITWFSVKMEPSATNGSKHIWKVIYNSRYLPENLKQIIDPVICRNAFMAHPENLLLSMLADERKHVRVLAARRIIKARRSHPIDEHRDFVVPKLNFEADDYIGMINWFECHVTEPPVTTDLSIEELMSVADNGSIKDLKCYKFPCHTQSVERCVKLVTEAASSVCGSHSRDGFIRTTLASRKIMPFFEHKGDYKLM